MTYHLTNREKEVMMEVFNGLSNQAIAEKLAISPRRVFLTVQQVLDKLDISDRYFAAEKLYQDGKL